MENHIQKYNYFTNNNFSEEHFFKDILEFCYKEKLLNDKILAKIYYERVDLLKIKLKYYTKDESSSARVEVVQSVLECIDYTIGIYLKTFKDIEILVEKLKHISLFDMLDKGQSLIKSKILESKWLFRKINKDKLKVNNYSYSDTIEGIVPFFKEYDDFFKAQETPGSIDYQLSIQNINYVGIEYIYNYLYNLNLENEFCSKFDIDEVNKLLKGYDEKCELLLINIFDLVLINSLGLVICGKDLNNLNINNLDRIIIKNKLEKLDLEKLRQELLKDAKICCEILFIKDKALIYYIGKATLKISYLINENIKINKLETVFISFNEEKKKEMIEYTDGEKMENSKFKKLSEKIRECPIVEGKIKLIKNNIKSLEDLIDILNADCLFEDEYTIYFKSLSKMEIILLSKYISNSTFEDDHEKEAYCKFNEFISNLSEKDQKNIDEMKKKINL